MNPETQTGLVIDGVTIRHADGRPLLGLSAMVPAGQVLSIMGPSGIGKSTLLAYLAGHLDPAFVGSGSVRLHGRDITSLPAQQRRVGLLFQDALLFPHITVGENLLFALPEAVKPLARRRQAVEEALIDIGLTGMSGRDPESLSGGEKARVALARVLLSQPGCLLLDEPFSRLDAALRHDIRTLVFGRARMHGLPTVLVTHDPADAEAAGGAVIDIGMGDKA